MPGLARGTGRALFANAPIPMRFPGLSIWLDAADINSFLLSGNNVSRWNDKSGNGRHFVTGTSPVINSVHLNGLDVVTFNGSSQFLQWAGSVEVRTICSVLRLNTASNNRTWFGVDRGDSAQVAALYLQHASLRAPAFRRTTTSDSSQALDLSASSAQQGNDVWHRYFGNLFDEAATKVVRSIVNNDAPVTDTATNALRPRGANMSIGAGQWDGSRTDWFPGSIAEVIIYDQPLGLGDLAVIDGYFRRKWGL